MDSTGVNITIQHNEVEDAIEPVKVETNTYLVEEIQE
jgi:hypothetical protein